MTSLWDIVWNDSYRLKMWRSWFIFLNFKIWLWLLYFRRGLNPFSHFSNEDDSCHEQQGSDDNADDGVDKWSFGTTTIWWCGFSPFFFLKDSDPWGLSFGAEVLASGKGVVEVAFVAGQAIKLSQMGTALGVSNSGQYK